MKSSLIILFPIIILIISHRFYLYLNKKFSNGNETCEEIFKNNSHSLLFHLPLVWERLWKFGFGRILLHLNDGLIGKQSFMNVQSPLTIEDLLMNDGELFERNIHFSCSNSLSELYKINEQIFPNSTRSEMMKHLYGNISPFILTMFPNSAGWPFPKYRAICNNLLITEKCGDSLDNFYESSFSKKIKIAGHIWRNFHDLQNKSSQHSIYLMDFNDNNFVVRDVGNDEVETTIVDVDALVVVAKKKTNRMRRSRLDILFEDDDGMVSIPIEELCNGEMSDHNFFLFTYEILLKRLLINIPQSYESYELNGRSYNLSSDLNNFIKFEDEHREIPFENLNNIFFSLT
ncbi:hypothetical protein SNEBB_001543 [Seison nebaliae]|nr:hypothetical protein SNEBB_001543 [Seison nebaliae]